MATIKNGLDILKADGPKIEYFVHMNVLYILTDININCDWGQDFDRMELVVGNYGEGEDGTLNREDFYGSVAPIYEKFQVGRRKTPEMFPPYSIWFRIKNNWVELGATLMFESVTNLDGNNFFPSIQTKIQIDNRIPILCCQKISSFFKGKLFDHMEDEKYFTVWIDLDNPQDSKPNDIIADKSGSYYRQITRILPPDTAGGEPRIVADKVDKYFLDFVSYIVRHPNTPDMFIDKFGLTAPPAKSKEAIFKFKVVQNFKEYLVIFRGDFQFLIDRKEANLKEYGEDYGNPEL
jgi:hypothetical protein